MAAHVHSEWSDDGSWTLTRIATTFTRLGYDVVLMSEHSRGFTAAKWPEYVDACREASSDRLMIVPGIEYGDEDDVVHIPVWGSVPFFGDGRPIGKLLAEVGSAQGIAMWAHPWRRDAWRRLSLLARPARRGRGLEPQVRRDRAQPGRAHAGPAEGIRAAVALDFHTRRQLFPLTLRLDLDARPTEAAVHAALAARRFSPRAFGLPVERLARGPGGAALRGLETVRRTAAHALR